MNASVEEKGSVLVPCQTEGRTAPSSHPERGFTEPLCELCEAGHLRAVKSVSSEDRRASDPSAARGRFRATTNQILEICVGSEPLTLEHEGLVCNGRYDLLKMNR